MAFQIGQVLLGILAIGIVSGNECRYDSSKYEPMKNHYDNFYHFNNYIEWYNAIDGKKIFVNLIDRSYEALETTSNDRIASILNYQIPYCLGSICWKYDPAPDGRDFGTKVWPFACYSKEFFCTLETVMTKVFGNLEKSFGGYHLVKDYMGWFEAPTGNWHGTVQSEYRLVAKVLFYNPQTIGPYFKKGDETGMWQTVSQRILYYIEKNCIERLKDFVAEFNSMRDDATKSCASAPDSLYCNISHSFKVVDDMVTDVDSKTPWKYDDGPPKTQREELAYLWILHPDKRKYFGITTDTMLTTYRLRTFFKTLYQAILAKDLNTLKDYDSKFVSIRNQANSYCSPMIHSEIFCFMAKALNHLNKMISAVGDNAAWTSTEASQRRTATLLWFLGTNIKDYLQLNDDDIKTQHEITLDIFSIIYKYSTKNDPEGIQRFISYLPDIVDMKSSATCEGQVLSLNTNLGCIFEQSFQQVLDFLDAQRANAGNVKVLDRTYNFKDLLNTALITSVKISNAAGQLQIKASLLDYTQQIKEFVADESGRRFGALEKYFYKIADFDLQKIKADLGVVVGYLENYRTQINIIRPELVQRVNGILIGAITANLAEMSQRSAEVALAWALAPNPMDPDPLTALDKVNALAQSGVTQIKSIRLRVDFENVINKGKSIMERMMQNQVFIENTHQLVNDINKDPDAYEITDKAKLFLKDYNDYEAKVSGSEITEYSALWGLTIDEGCANLYAGGTAASAVVEAIFAGMGDCYATKAQATKLMGIYEAMFEKQDDYFESLAAIVRSYVAKAYSKELNTNYKSLVIQDTAVEQVRLNQIALSTFLVSQLHRIMLVQQYCHQLEYRNGGVMPNDCITALKTLTDNDIGKVKGLDVGSQCWDKDPAMKFVKIPTWPKNSTDTGYINLQDLYLGKEVSFKIPDVNWLVQNNWITPVEATGIAFYVRGFSLFLSHEDSAERTVLVSIHPDGPAPLFKDSKVSYSITPPEYLHTEYKEHVYACYKKKFDNPYSICDPGLEKVCVNDEGITNINLNPSVFSPWTLKMSMTPSGKVPLPVSDMYVRASIDLCKTHIGKETITKRSASTYSSVSCCTDNGSNSFFSHASSSCQSCPAGSTAKLHGYFCQRNTECGDGYIPVNNGEYCQKIRPKGWKPDQLLNINN